MNLRTLALVLAIAGAGLLVAAIVINQQNFGSCPAATVGTPPCDHTFSGTTIGIGQTASEVGIVAFALLVTTVAVASYGYLTNLHQG